MKGVITFIYFLEVSGKEDVGDGERKRRKGTKRKGKKNSKNERNNDVEERNAKRREKRK